MGVKKKLGLGLASAALGLSLVGGGTYAYFNDKAEASSSFAAGTLDLNVDPTTVIDVQNIKPGDTMDRAFKLVNSGSLDIKKVLLTTEYSVVNKDGAAANVEDFADHIKVNFLWNADKLNDVIYSTKLSELKDMDPNVIDKNVFTPLFERKGLRAGSTDDLYVQFEFVDNGEDQNEFQGDSLKMKWTFEAYQGKNEEK
ncbi:M73 family metallopeptidase [Metabacillus sp. KIGAM252]|uniref:M73 family metallopeptidase n=1 Tax=Metabacillus flavus TaxID=2823519 RepID=A0ABS5LFV5_9BACI|nr:CalY family protein [Metabacillus flavus]MBS2969627.1 M73 family metallopeptidase [Metabacillus flavus]